MVEVWRSRQDAGLWPSERAMLQTHCRNLGAVVCNIGCGAGRETFALHKLGYQNLHGIDASETLLRAASARCREDGLKLHFEAAGADKLPFADATFDVITMFENLFGHITPHSARLQSLAEARRVLKPGGVILLTVTSLNHSRMYRFYFELLALVRRFYNPTGMESGDKPLKRGDWPPGAVRMTAPRTHWFSPDEIPADAKAVGLTVIQRTTTNAVARNPDADSFRYRGEGRLVYVLGLPDAALSPVRLERLECQ
jgi:SAM-dependent methyltransferase